jgi:hypothetical protein
VTLNFSRLKSNIQFKTVNISTDTEIDEPAKKTVPASTKTALLDKTGDIFLVVP